MSGRSRGAASAAGPDVVFLRGDGILPDKGAVEAGVIVEAALPGRVSRSDAALHQALGVQDALIKNVLVDGNVGVAFELMQQGVFADEKTVRQAVQGDGFQDMVVDVPDHLVDPVRRPGRKHVFLAYGFAGNQGKQIDPAAVHQPCRGILFLRVGDAFVHQADEACGAVLVRMIGIIPAPRGFLQDVQHGEAFVRQIGQDFAGRVEKRPLIGTGGIQDQRPVQHIRRKNEQVHGMGIEAFILDADLDLSADKKVELIVGMHVERRGFPLGVQEMPEAGFGAGTDIVELGADQFVHLRSSPALRLGGKAKPYPPGISAIIPQLSQ